MSTEKQSSGSTELRCGAMVGVRRWRVKRTVEEIIEAYGRTREEAIAYANEKGDPGSVRIVRETATPTND